MESIEFSECIMFPIKLGHVSSTLLKFESWLGVAISIKIWLMILLTYSIDCIDFRCSQTIIVIGASSQAVQPCNMWFESGMKSAEWIFFVFLTLMNFSSSVDISFGASKTLYNVQEGIVALGGSMNRTYHIRSVAPDLYSDQSYIISTDTAVYRVLGSEGIKLLAGHVTEEGYEDGEDDEVRFNGVWAMKKWTNRYIISDHLNHCIRCLKPSSSKIEVVPLAGFCTVSGDQIGPRTNARFSYPYGLAIDGDMLYIADSKNHKIKALDLKVPNSFVTVVHTSHSIILCDLILGRKQNEFFVTAKSGILQIENSTETWLVGNAEFHGFSEGQFSSSGFNSPQGIAMLSTDHLVIADRWNFRLRLIDLKQKYTSSICTGWGSLDGNIDVCELLEPWSILLTDTDIIIGESSELGAGLRSLPYNVIKGGDKSGSTSLQLQCSDPPEEPNAYFDYKDSYNVGMVVQYTCTDYYEPLSLNETELLCVEYGDEAYWAGPAIVCVLRTSTIVVIVLATFLLLTLIALIIESGLCIYWRRQLLIKTSTSQPYMTTESAGREHYYMTPPLYSEPSTCYSESYLTPSPAQDNNSVCNHNDGYIEVIS